MTKMLAKPKGPYKPSKRALLKTLSSVRGRLTRVAARLENDLGEVGMAQSVRQSQSGITSAIAQLEARIHAGRVARRKRTEIT